MNPQSSSIAVFIAFTRAPSGEAIEKELRLASGATVADALSAAKALEDFPKEVEFTPAIDGRTVAPDATLENGVRVDFLRELVRDPKTARLNRAKLHPLRHDTSQNLRNKTRV